MAPDARRREKTPRDLTRVCVLSVEKTRFRKLRARPSPAKTEVEGVGSRRIGRVRDARKSSTREPRRVTRNHDSRVSSRRATTFLADTRVRNRRLTHHHGPHHLPLRLLLPRRLPRGGRRASLAPLSSPLSRRSNTRAAASVAAEKEVALTFRALLTDTQWFSNFLAPSGVMLPMSGAPTERARSTLRIIPVDVTVRPLPPFYALPRRVVAFSTALFPRSSLGPVREKKKSLFG